MTDSYAIDSTWVEEWIYIEIAVDPVDGTKYINTRCELCTHSFGTFLSGYPRPSGYIAKAVQHYQDIHPKDRRYKPLTPLP